MITVSIMINGGLIMARSAVNKGKVLGEDWCSYAVDDGTTLIHKQGDGAVTLSIEMLRTLLPMERRDKPELLKQLLQAVDRIMTAEEDGDGHEYIHAMRDARRLVGRIKQA